MQWPAMKRASRTTPNRTAWRGRVSRCAYPGATAVGTPCEPIFASTERREDRRRARWVDRERTADSGERASPGVSPVRRLEDAARGQVGVEGEVETGVHGARPLRVDGERGDHHR